MIMTSTVPYLDVGWFGHEAIARAPPWDGSHNGKADLELGYTDWQKII